jgi:hypothetical protein
MNTPRRTPRCVIYASGPSQNHVVFTRIALAMSISAVRLASTFSRGAEGSRRLRPPHVQPVGWSRPQPAAAGQCADRSALPRGRATSDPVATTRVMAPCSTTPVKRKETAPPKGYLLCAGWLPWVAPLSNARDVQRCGGGGRKICRPTSNTGHLSVSERSCCRSPGRSARRAQAAEPTERRRRRASDGTSCRRPQAVALSAGRPG